MQLLDPLLIGAQSLPLLVHVKLEFLLHFLNLFTKFISHAFGIIMFLKTVCEQMFDILKPLSVYF